MKKIILPFFLVIITISVKSQSVKFLFDATKAETAGNADWVIDADTWNLGYGRGPASLSGGNEANAQRYPTPNQNGITSATTQDYWTGALSAWGVDLVKKGYTVETLPYNGTISYGNTSNPQDLSNYKVFVVDEPNIVFTTAEKTAMLNFVLNGGGLFIISDHTVSDRNGDGWDSPAIWNDFLAASNPFGFTFDLQNYSETTTNIANLPGDPLLHGIMGNVTEIMYSNGTSMTIDPSANSSVKAIIYKKGATQNNNNVDVAYATYGSGRVVAIGDSSPEDDGSGDPGDQLYDGWITDASGNHERLIMNASVWLANAGSVSVNNIDNSNIEVYSVTEFSNQTKIHIISNENFSGNSVILISDMLGRIVNSFKLTNKEESFLINTKPGIYIYSLISEGNVLKSGKIMVQ
jgi:hypothetical protein